MNKACFLDRDGVIIEEECYLNSPDQVKLILGTIDALRKTRENGFLNVVLTNQSGVARGYYPENAINAVHKRIDELLLAAGAEVAAYYYCPHLLDAKLAEYAVDCECRKPKPGMFLKAAKDLNIDLSQSFMIGDKISDLRAAENAGCPDAIMVRTGHGEEQILEHDTSKIIVCDDIKAAIEHYFSRHS